MRLFNSFNKNNRDLAIVDDKNFKLTYAQTLNETNRIKKEIKQRSLILIISDNSIGFLISYIFCILNNHVAIILDSKTSRENLIKIFKNYQPNFIFLQNESSGIFKKFCKNGLIFFNQRLMKNNFKKKK